MDPAFSSSSWVGTISDQLSVCLEAITPSLVCNGVNKLPEFYSYLPSIATNIAALRMKGRLRSFEMHKDGLESLA